MCDRFRCITAKAALVISSIFHSNNKEVIFMKPFHMTVKDTLMGLIDEMAADPRPFVRHPGTDFTRGRKLGFRDTVSLVLSMGGSTLSQELLGYFRYNLL